MRNYNNHNVSNISYHIVWIPKYRKHILVGEIKKELIKIFKIIEEKININIEIFEIMSDHIHLFVKGNQNITISNTIKYLKGYSSYELRKKFVFLKKYKSLWTPSYFCETIGHISEDTVKKYIENQNNH
jgi:putative transposase